MKIKEVERYIEEHGLNTSCRERELVDQRNYLYKYIRITYGLSYVKIGTMFNKNHATVLHGIGNYEQLKRTKDYIRNICFLIKEFPIRSEMEFLTSSVAGQGMVITQLNQKQYLKLARFRLDNEIRTNEEAVKKLIDNILH